MQKLLIAFLLVFSLPSFAQSGEKNFIDLNYIEVTGKAEMQVVPDMIYIKIKISEKDKKEPIAAVEKKMMDKLQEIGIDIKKDLSVNDFSSRFYNKFLSKDIVLSKEFLLLVHDAKTVSKVYSELERLDISNVSIDRVDHTKMEEFRKEVKANAIKAAKEKAEYITKAINQSIGRAIYIQEIENIPLNFASNYASNRRAAYDGTGAIHRAFDDGSDIDLDFEKIKLEYAILARFELK